MNLGFRTCVRASSRIAAAVFYGLTLHVPGRQARPRKYEWKGSSLVLAWSPTAKYIATGEQDSTVHFWHVKSGKDAQMWGFATKVLQLSWFLRVWNPQQSVKPITMGTFPSAISRVAWSPNDRLLAIGQEDGGIAGMAVNVEILQTKIPGILLMRTLNAQTHRLQTTLQRGEPLVTRRGAVLGQLIFCEGCCCGRTDRGFPPLPKDRIKGVWKSKKLNQAIQLTISGCLGPCDLANVVAIVRANGHWQWLGGLSEEWQYDMLIQWAESCQQAGRFQPLPERLTPHLFSRFDRPRNCQESLLEPMKATIAFFWTMIGVLCRLWDLPEAIQQWMRQDLIPGLYLAQAAGKVSGAVQRQHLRDLSREILVRARSPAGPWGTMPSEMQADLEQKAQLCADLFQRSSSCVEGRNGQLSLKHHALHRFKLRKLQALKVLHNYLARRPDGTTAAERFYGAPSQELFAWLLDHLAIPSRPRSRRRADLNGTSNYPHINCWQSRGRYQSAIPATVGRLWENQETPGRVLCHRKPFWQMIDSGVMCNAAEHASVRMR